MGGCSRIDKSQRLLKGASFTASRQGGLEVAFRAQELGAPRPRVGQDYAPVPIKVLAHQTPTSRVQTDGRGCGSGAFLLG